MRAKENIVEINIKPRCWIEAILVFIGFVMSRPMLLGNNYSIAGLVILILIGVAEVCRSNGRIRKDNNAKIYFISLAFFLYCTLSCIFSQSDRMQDGLQTIIYLIGCSTVFFLIGTNPFLKTALVRIIYLVLSFFAISYVVSVLLMLSVGWNSIRLFEIDYGYFIKATVYFPFTITYGDLSFNGIIFKRLLGFARESGIMQLFYIWGFYMCDKYFRKTLFLKVLMCIGIAACLSTTGFIVFTVSLLFYLDIKKLFSWKTVIAIGLIVIGIYVIFFANGTSIFTRAAATITDRMSGMTAGFEGFKENPLFGKGFYDTLGFNNKVQVGVSAISSLGQIGIVGLFLWLLPYYVAFNICSSKKRYLYSVIPIIATGMFAQPLLAAPATYLFLYMDYNDDILFVAKPRRAIHKAGLRVAR